MLAVGIGSTIALTTRQTPTATPAAGLPTSPTMAPDDPPTSPSPPPPREPDGSREAARAVATARSFLAQQLGMTDMVAGPFRSTGARAGEVGFRHKYGEGRRLLGEDREPSDGFSLVWRYSNEPFLAHLGIEAIGPGGATTETLDIVHPEP